MKIKLQVKEALESKGWTQKQLADETGIRPAAISNIVRSFVERLNLDHLERIANALGIDNINELITLEKE